MKKYLPYLPLVAGLLINSTLYAQTTLPYSSGFDNAAGKAGWQQLRKGSDGLYEWNFNTALPYSPAESLGHSYPVGGTTITDDWFVSPPFNLPEGGNMDSLRYSFSGFGVPGVGDTVALYLLAGNADPEAAATITLLYDFRGDGYVGDGQWRLLEDIDLPATAGTSYIAFRYKTTVNWLDVKFDNFSLSSAGRTGIDPELSKLKAVSFFPNPTSGKLSIQSEVALKEVTVMDIAGRIVHRQYGSTEMDLSEFGNGVYIVTCGDFNNHVIAKRILKF